MFERTPNVWEVTLQAPDGQTTVEKVQTYWSATFESIKTDVGNAARAAAKIRNKGKIEFQVLEAKFLGKLSDPEVTA